jgi:hypothetical protein
MANLGKHSEPSRPSESSVPNSLRQAEGKKQVLQEKSQPARNSNRLPAK